MYFESKKIHSKYIELLTNCILVSHVDLRMYSKTCTCHCSSNSVLSCPSFCNNAFLFHFFCKKCLSKCIVYLMSSAMKQVLSFKINFCTADFFCKVFCKVKWGWPSCVIF